MSIIAPIETVNLANMAIEQEIIVRVAVDPGDYGWLNQPDLNHRGTDLMILMAILDRRPKSPDLSWVRTPSAARIRDDPLDPVPASGRNVFPVGMRSMRRPDPVWARARRLSRHRLMSRASALNFPNT